jgi:DNA-binding NarL/FixJ family response regulator
MMQARIVILSGQSLFAEGLASRLRQYLGPAEIQIVDPLQPDVLAQVAAAQPSAVILDGTDAEVTQLCSLGGLLLALPDLKIIVLDPREDQAQVVTSERHLAASVRDLALVIEQSV